MDHRRLQRTLFRMQLDPGFAARLRAGDVDAARGLAKPELELLLDADARAVSADRDGRRAAQFLANVASEFPLSRAAGLRVDGFIASPEFHEAVCEDSSLPLAFARYAVRCTGEQPGAVRALLALESALAHARREPRTCRPLRTGEIVLAPGSALEAVPDGTLELAAKIRTALDASTPLPPLELAGDGVESLLVRSAPSARALELRGVEVERLSPALADLLRAALEPTTRAALGAATATPQPELDPVIDELVVDRVLLAG